MENRTDLPIWETIGLGWEKVKGAKATIWGALIIFFVIGLGLGVLSSLSEHIHIGLYVITAIAAQLIQLLLQFGLYYIGVRRAADQPISYDLMFKTFSWEMLWKIVCFVVLALLFVYIPFFIILAIGAGLGMVLNVQGLLWLAALLGIIWIFYAGARISLGIGLIPDKGLSGLEAFKKSFELTKSYTLQIIGIYLMALIIIAISALPLLIGLIWTLPWSLVLYGVVYQRLTGRMLPAVQTTTTPSK